MLIFILKNITQFFKQPALIYAHFPPFTLTAVGNINYFNLSALMGEDWYVLFKFPFKNHE